MTKNTFEMYPYRLQLFPACIRETNVSFYGCILQLLAPHFEWDVGRVVGTAVIVMCRHVYPRL